MKKQQNLPDLDISFYQREIAPWLPPRILDFHAHTWSANEWLVRPWETDASGGRYMVTETFYPPAQLLADGRYCFPDREYEAVCFGYPTPAVDWEKDTAYVAAAARQYPELKPLLLAGPALDVSTERYAQVLDEGRFYGFKVFLNWFGNNYGDVAIDDMMGPTERKLANERRLVVMLHVPRSGRLADPIIQAGIRDLARECPNAQIVLAHCGRCYLPGEMSAAIGCLRGLDNVWLDSSMVMDPVVLQLVLKEVGSARLLFASDFPVAAMRGRRVQVLDHWVDVVLPGYPKSAYRVSGEGFAAGPMVWEIVLALRWACELCGVTAAERQGIFYDNGAALLQRVQRTLKS